MLGSSSRRIVSRVSLSQRSFSTNPFPAGSMIYTKYEACLDKATEAGVDLFVDYSPWLPVDLMQNTMLAMEAVLPFGGWPLAIAATAVISRAMLFPVQLWSMRKSRSSQTVMKDMEAINKKLKRASEKGDSKATSRFQEKYNTLVSEHGRFFAVKGMVGSLMPIPLFMTSFATLRGFAEHPQIFTSFALKDPLWLDSLALPDPYFVLPVLSAGLFLTNLELTGRLDSAAGSAADVRKSVLGDMGAKYGNVLTDDFMAKIKKYGLRGVVVSSLYFTTSFPAACFFFFIPNTILAISQNRILRKEAVQVWLGIQPPPAAESLLITPSTTNATSLADFVKSRRAERKLQELVRPTAHQRPASPKIAPSPSQALASPKMKASQVNSKKVRVLKPRSEPSTVKELLALAKKRQLVASI